MNSNDFKVNAQGVLEKYLGSDQKVDIPNNITKIGEYAFAKCSQLKVVQFNNGIKEIGEKAFFYCSNLQEIILPNSIKNIDVGAFSFCSSLTKVVLPNELDKIKAFTFSKCSNLTEINIPNTVSYIDEKAFLDCSKLEKLNIPATLKLIHKSAFEGCSDKLTSTIKIAYGIIKESSKEKTEETNISIRAHECKKKQIKIGENDFLVSQDGTGNYTTISEAIENAKEGAKIYVNSGSYEEYLEINKDIELIGDKEDKPQVYIEKGTVCTVKSNAKISFFEFFNTDYSEPEEEKYDDKEDDDDDDFGYSEDEDDEEYDYSDDDDEDYSEDDDDEDDEYDSGDSLFPLIDIKGNAVFNNCIVKQSMKIGIGVIEECTPTISECSISECNFTGIFTTSTPIISDCNFEKNKTAHIDVEDHGNPTITNCNILYGREKSVGILFSSDSFGEVKNCHIRDNLYGVFLSDNAVPTIVKSELYNNRIAGISCGDESSASIFDCSVHNNKTGIEIIKDSNLDVSNCKIYNNEENGIELKDNANVSLDQSKIFQNGVNGLYLKDGSSCSILDVQSYKNGVANFYFKDNVNIDINNCKLYESDKVGAFFDGCVRGKMDNIEIYDNHDSGILLYGDAFPRLLNCKISGGLGICAEEDVACKIEDCEIYDCSNYGLAVAGHSTLLIKDSKITNSNCRFFDHSRPTVTNCNFTNVSISVENISNPSILDSSLEESSITIDNRASGLYKNCKIKGENSEIVVDGRGFIEGNPKTGEAEYLQGEMNPTIEDCEMSGSSSSLLSILELDRGTYKNCNIHDTSDSGVYIRGDIELQNFEIHDCNIGVELISGEPTFTNCNFHDNKQDIKEIDYSEYDLDDDSIDDESDEDFEVDYGDE